MRAFDASASLFGLIVATLELSFVRDGTEHPDLAPVKAAIDHKPPRSSNFMLINITDCYSLHLIAFNAEYSLPPRLLSLCWTSSVVQFVGTCRIGLSQTVQGWSALRRARRYLDRAIALETLGAPESHGSDQHDQQGGKAQICDGTGFAANVAELPENHCICAFRTARKS
jgi:hypothetical protein